MINNSVNFSVFSAYRGALMSIAILGMIILHEIGWAEIEDSLFAMFASPFARIAFTYGFIFLSGFCLYYSFRKNSNLKDRLGVLKGICGKLATALNEYTEQKLKIRYEIKKSILVNGIQFL